MAGRWMASLCARPTRRQIARCLRLCWCMVAPMGAGGMASTSAGPTGRSGWRWPVMSFSCPIRAAATGMANASQAARGDVGGADYADVMSALDAAIERGIADPERLGIGGWSQGGFMTAWAVTQTRRFKAAIMGAGVSDWGMMAMTSDIPDFERELGGSVPWDGLEYQNHLRLSPISFARETKTPVLILHGEKDARVPLTQAIGFHRALREYGVPTELVVYPREGHPIRERMHQLDLLRRVRSWYDRWLRS